jgi:hypothetical protein
MSAAAITATATATAAHTQQPPPTAYDELLKYHGLSVADVQRLKDNDVTVIDLMTKQIVPIALNMYNASHMLLSMRRISSEEIELFALTDLGDKINDAKQANNDFDYADGSEVDLKSKLPQWMTWQMLYDWSEHIQMLWGSALAETHPTSQYTPASS